MVKGKVFSNVLLAIALVVSSAAVAHAGAGSGSGLLVTLFNCYVIEDGANSPYVLTLNDQFGTRNHVHVGKARLLCTPTTPGDFVDKDGLPIPNEGALVERGPELTFVDQGDPNFGHLKCYDAAPRHANGREPIVKITDPFGQETVELEKSRFLCAPAIKEVVGFEHEHHRK